MLKLVVLAIIASCSKQPARPLSAQPLQQAQPLQTDALGARWETTEGIWRGSWIRRAGTDTFDATWTSNEYGTFHGVVRVAVANDRITIDRHDLEREWANADSRCAYTATLHGDRVTDGSTWCETNQQIASPVWPWSARILAQ